MNYFIKRIWRSFRRWFFWDITDLPGYRPRHPATIPTAEVLRRLDEIKARSKRR